MRFIGFLFLCQEYRILCPVWRPWCRTQSVTHSAFLVFFPLQDQRDSLFFHPCIYSGRNHSSLPLILLLLKSLCKVSSIHLRFYERLEEFLSWSSSCFHFFLYKFPLLVLVSSFRNLLKTLICGQPSHPILFAFMLFFF